MSGLAADRLFETSDGLDEADDDFGGRHRSAVLHRSLEEGDEVFGDERVVGESMAESCEGFGEFVRHADTVAVAALEDETWAYRMSNTFGGYDWGEPICLWNRKVPRAVFTLEQWAIADRAVAS